jgi:hypothetical protein
MLDQAKITLRQALLVGLVEAILVVVIVVLVSTAPRPLGVRHIVPRS